LGWVGRGLVLVMISVVSGLIWSAIKPHQQNPAPSAQQGPQTAYSFTPTGRPEVDAKAADCKSISTGQVRELFSHTECAHVTRQLFTATLPGGQKVLASVITVTMPDDKTSAARLQSLAKGHDTGQIYALSHSQAQVGSLDDNVAYQTQRNGNILVIGDAGYYGRQKQPDNDPTLTNVSKEAIKLSRGLRVHGDAPPRRAGRRDGQRVQRGSPQPGVVGGFQHRPPTDLAVFLGRDERLHRRRLIRHRDG
jgi:hypothetical protein